VDLMTRLEATGLLVLAVSLGIYANMVGKEVSAMFLFALAAYALLSLLWGFIRGRHA
jgi:hypothetical protein